MKAKTQEERLKADEYAIDFAEWYYCKKLLLTYSPTKKISELLEIYKKEKISTQ